MSGVRQEPELGGADAAPSRRHLPAWRTHGEDPGTLPGPQYEHRHATDAGALVPQKGRLGYPAESRRCEGAVLSCGVSDIVT